MSGCPERKTILQLKTFEVKSEQRGSIQAVEKTFDADWAAHFSSIDMRVYHHGRPTYGAIGVLRSVDYEGPAPDFSRP
jgi:hypothetical protein